MMMQTISMLKERKSDEWGRWQHTKEKVVGLREIWPQEKGWEISKADTVISYTDIPLNGLTLGNSITTS